MNATDFSEFFRVENPGRTPGADSAVGYDSIAGNQIFNGGPYGQHFPNSFVTRSGGQRRFHRVHALDRVYVGGVDGRQKHFHQHLGGNKKRRWFPN